MALKPVSARTGEFRRYESPFVLRSTPNQNLKNVLGIENNPKKVRTPSINDQNTKNNLQI
jgi:hypothetical protein